MIWYFFKNLKTSALYSKLQIYSRLCFMQEFNFRYEKLILWSLSRHESIERCRDYTVLALSWSCLFLCWGWFKVRIINILYMFMLRVVFRNLSKGGGFYFFIFQGVGQVPPSGPVNRRFNCARLRSSPRYSLPEYPSSYAYIFSCESADSVLTIIQLH